MKRTACGVELPGNNFPPLCELAFIRLHRGHLETFQLAQKVGLHKLVKGRNKRKGD